jgi:hypothetical protein
MYATGITKVFDPMLQTIYFLKTERVGRTCFSIRSMTASTSRSAAVRPLRFLAGRTAPASPEGSIRGGSGTRGSSSGGMSRGPEAAPPGPLLPSQSSSVADWPFLDLQLHKDKHNGSQSAMR